jgi:hypothetical protein
MRFPNGAGTLAFVALSLWGCFAYAGQKTYTATRLVELTRAGGRWGHSGFCFVVQLDDLAYVAFTDDKPPRNLIVGDPLQIRIKGDHMWIRTDKKPPDDEIKTTISIRERMTGDAKLPTCSLSVSVH